LRCGPGDQVVDLDPMLLDGSDQFAGELGRRLVAFGFRQVALQNRRRRSLTEVRFEDRGERKPATVASSAGAVSPRRHRRGR